MNGFERRSAKKREQILQTALEIMNHPNGINNLTVQKIVEATAISKATIFKYFEGKPHPRNFFLLFKSNEAKK